MDTSLSASSSSLERLTGRDLGDVAVCAQAVAALPALPVADPGDRYGPRPLTMAWLAGRPATTRRAYFRDLAAWLGWCARVGLDPLAARRADADAWVAHLDGAPRTVARRIAGVSSWYRYLIDHEVAERNPMTGVRRPRLARDESPTVGLTEQQAAAVLTAADAHARRVGSEAALRDAAILRLLFDTGLRVGSLLGADIASLGYDAGHRILRYVNKGGYHKRAVIPPHAAELLDRYLARRAARAGLPVDQLSGPLVVTTPHRTHPGGRRLTRQAVTRALHRAAQAAGIPHARRLSPHSARKTFVTLALAAGVPLERVQAAVGHQDPRTTLLYQDGRDALDQSPVYTVAGRLAAAQHRLT